MYCTNCGNQLQEQSNFCSRCGAKVAAGSPPAAAPAVAQNEETTAQKFWKRLGQATLLYLQQQAVANAIRQRQSGDNFWSSATASGNDNGQSGYVDVGGTIVGYDH
jgi:predicted amidophosphoribosyltransferase